MSDNLFDALDAEERTGAGVAISSAVVTPAERAAMAQRYARELGLPAETVVRNLPQVEREATVTRGLSVLAEAPKTRQWFASPDNAAVAHDVIEPLAAMETALGRVFDVARSIPEGAVRGTGMAIRGIPQGLSAVQRSVERGLSAWNEATGPAIMRGQSADTAARHRQTGPIAAGGARAGRAVERTADRIGVAPDRRNIATDIGSGVGQLVPQIAAFVANPAAGLAMLLGQGAAEMSDVVDENGAAATPEGDLAIIAGAGATAALERLGIFAILEKAPPQVKNAVLRRLAALTVAGGAEAATEAAQQVAQNAVEMALLNPDQELLDGAGHAAVVGGGVGVIGRALLDAAIPGRTTLRDRERAAAAPVQVETFNQAVEAIRANPLLERSPERLQELIRSVAGDSDVYVPVEQVDAYMQSLPPEEADALLDEWGVLDQYDQALDIGSMGGIGGDIVIPADVYLTRIAPTPAHEAWAPNLRLGPDAMSAEQAKAFEDEFDALVKGRASEVVEKAKADEDAAAPAQRVYQEVFSKARESGFNIDTARQYAALLGARYATRAARLGSDAYAEYQRSGVTLQQHLPETVQREIDRIDMLINALRARVQPQTQRQMLGPSLLEFVSAKGGVTDRGGEFSAMDAGKWHVGKPGKRRLIRHDSGDERAIEHGPERIAEAARDAGYLREGTEAELLAAVRDELAGKQRFSEHNNVDPAREGFGQALDDLEELLAYLGLNPADASNEEIKAALEQHRAPEGAEYDQVPPETAMGLRYETKMPEDPLFAEAVANTPGAEITPDGLLIELVRFQKPEQEGDYAARTGVFYLPVKSANVKHYRGSNVTTTDKGPAWYGGSEKVSGVALIRAPLFVKGGTGGKAPEAAWEALKGKGAMKALTADIMHVVGGSHVLKKDGLLEEAVSALLERNGGDPDLAYQLIQTSTKGNQFRYALQEHIIAHAVRDAGHDAIVGYTKGKAGAMIAEVFDVRETTYPTADGETEIHRSFYQSDASYEKDARGRVQFGSNRALITLFRDRDLSTLLHEWAGHVFLEEMIEDASLPNAPEQMRADLQTVLDWFGIASPAEIKVEHHEMWARAAEAYLMEGKAPSVGLRAAFGKFKSWLISIYRTVAALDTPINDDIRRVLDRLIATDAEIEAARKSAMAEALFTTAAEAGMTDAEFAAYTRSVERSREAGHDTLLRKVMAGIRRERTAAWKEEAEALRPEIATQIDAAPDMAALNLLTTGGMRLSADAVVALYGDETALKMLPARVPPLHAKSGGVHPDNVAAAAGFDSGDAMIRALWALEAERQSMKAAGDKRSVRTARIEAALRDEMELRHGDVLSDGSIEEEALDAIHNDRQAAVLATELKALGRKVGQEPTPLQVMRAWAARSVASKKVRDGTQAGRYLRTERTAANAVQEALAAGDGAEAFRQKQVQTLNHLLYIEAKRAAEDTEKAVERLGKYADARTIKSLDQDYLEQIHGLLERFDFKRATLKEVGRRKSFAAFVLAKQADGETVHAPERLLNDAFRTHYLDMTVEELRGLTDSVKSIAHLGRLKQELLDNKEWRDREALVDEAINRAGDLPGPKETDLLNPKPNALKGLDAALWKMETLADWLDKADIGGVFNRVLIRPAVDAANHEGAMHERVGQALKAQYDAIPAAARKRWLDRIELPELVNPQTGRPYTLTRGELLAVALNVGTESNLEKMAKGYGWDAAAVEQALVRELSQDEWQFVQGVWDTLETLWPDIAKVERKLVGVEPERVTPREVVTPAGALRGGYYPVVYDPNKSGRARANADKDASDLFNGIFFSAATPKGHTQSRTDYSAPVLLSVEGVLFNHVNKVIKRIAYGEFVSSAKRFIEDDRIRTLVEQKLGRDYYDQLMPWLQRQVNDRIIPLRGMGFWEGFAKTARINFQMVAMGFRVTTGLAQIAGLSSSAAVIGPQWMARGLVEMGRNPMAAAEFVFARSEEMKQRNVDLDRDLRDALRELAGRTDPLAKVRRAAFMHIGFTDRYIVALPTWLGAYYKALNEGHSEDDAAASGDKAVRTSQGSGRAKDLARVQAPDSEYMKLFTLFYSYFNVQYNRQREAVRDVGRGDFAKAFNTSFWLLAVAPIAGALLTGDWPEDEEDPEAWLAWAGRKAFFNLWTGVPLLRDATGFAERKVAGHYAEYAPTPLARVGSSTEDLMRDIWNASPFGEDEPSDRWLKHAIETPGYFVGLPTGQAANTGQYLWDLMQGDQRPDNVREFLKGMMKGPQKDQ